MVVEVVYRRRDNEPSPVPTKETGLSANDEEHEDSDAMLGSEKKLYCG